jgi:hypothetical protein
MRHRDGPRARRDNGLRTVSILTWRVALFSVIAMVALTTMLGRSG